MAKVLIVDDAEMNAELLSEMVKLLGVDTEIATNGKEAVDLVRQKAYDLIFMDHLMPVMDGMQAMAIIKEEKLCPNTPVVMVTANDASSDGRFYIDAGFSDYMQKPFSMDGVKAVLLKYGFIKVLDNREAWKNLSAEIKGINLDSPMKYCLSDSSFYLEVLEEYLKTDVLEGIESRLEAEETSELKFDVRSAKDSARLIGADDMAELALFMEKDIAQEDVKSFAEHLRDYRHLEKKLRKSILKAESLKNSHS